MLNRPRAIVLTAACCTLAAIGAPSVAQAHRGHDHFGRFVSHARQVQHVCAEAGVPLGGHSHGSWKGHGLSSLTETQEKELKAACEKLATAYAAKRTADEAAGKTLWEALKAARTKLDEACPAVTEHHGPGGWWSHAELSTACQEALRAFWTSAHEAKQAFRAAIEAAGKPFQAALTEFESATASIMAALEAAESDKFFSHGHRFGGPAGRGYGSPGSGQGYNGHVSDQGNDGSGSGHGDGDSGSHGSCGH